MTFKSVYDPSQRKPICITLCYCVEFLPYSVIALATVFFFLVVESRENVCVCVFKIIGYFLAYLGLMGSIKVLKGSGRVLLPSRKYNIV